MSVSTLHEKLASARMGEYRGAATAADFGDVRAEFEALVSRCGVYDLGWRAKISITGGDRVRWLNGMVTNNVRDLAIAHGVYAFLLNPQGHILADLYACNRGDSLLVDTDQSQLQKVLDTFDHYIIMDDVGVANVSDKLTAVGVAGPSARAVLRTAGIEFADLQPLQFVGLSWRQIGLTLVRADSPGVESYELRLAPEQVASSWEALVSAGAKPVGTSALELLRIACGIPRYGQDIRERDLPQETEQQRALHFSKGCYIGQEIVERIRSRGSVHRMFTGFMVEGPLPSPGTKIQMDGKDVGEITSVASLPAKTGQAPSLPVALGYIRRESAAAGKPLTAGDSRLTLAHLPFAEILEH
jgi:folate-binding protein YgfZ